MLSVQFSVLFPLPRDPFSTKPGKNNLMAPLWFERVVESHLVTYRI